MTGFVEPTSGSININAGNSIGFCLQNNILFDELTVREHLQFFTELKGVSGREVEHDVKKYLIELDLKPKMGALPSSLTFSMRRKLSVCLALCGGSKVVFCDEPSLGNFVLVVPHFSVDFAIQKFIIYYLIRASGSMSIIIKYQ